MKRSFQEKTFEELSSIGYKMLLTPSQRVKYRTILIVQFFGEYRLGSGGATDAQFMAGMLSAAATVWAPHAVITDLSGLSYKWGDEMDSMLGNYWPEKYHMLPCAVIVGPKSKEGVRTLLLGVNSTETLDSVEYVCESLEDGLDYVELLLADKTKREGFMRRFREARQDKSE